MKRTEDRWNAAAIGAIPLALALLTGGCSWGFSRDAHGTHSVSHHGDLHHGTSCTVCAGARPDAGGSHACSYCGETVRP